MKKERRLQYAEARKRNMKHGNELISYIPKDYCTVYCATTREPDKNFTTEFPSQCESNKKSPLRMRF